MTKCVLESEDAEFIEKLKKIALLVANDTGWSSRFKESDFKIHKDQVIPFLARELRNGNMLGLSDEELKGLSASSEELRKIIQKKKPEVFSEISEALGHKKKNSYHSAKASRDLSKMTDYLERVRKRFYDRSKKSSIKPLVDPKESVIPGASNYFKRR